MEGTKRTFPINLSIATVIKMNIFSLHPNVYTTSISSPKIDSLLRMLEKVWVHDHTPGKGTLYLISGFGTYNGGVRFFKVLEEHIAKGGRVVCFFAGSTAQRLTSKQLVIELIKTGAEIHIVNRKRLLHAKCYGASYVSGNDTLIVTSGNFTGPGLSLNGEAAVLLDDMTTRNMSFSWRNLELSLKAQVWNRYLLTPNLSDPGWKLLYDEQSSNLTIDSSEEVTMLIKLGAADTARIQAIPGTNAGRGSQYFWLSRDSYGFFPPLTIRNKRGVKNTFACDIKVHYISQRVSRQERVTFEAENNLDFRLGTGFLRYTKSAVAGDLAAISRTSEGDYELRIFPKADPLYAKLLSYAVNIIGNQGKQYGFLDNDDFTRITGVNLPSVPRGGFP